MVILVVMMLLENELIQCIILTLGLFVLRIIFSPITLLSWLLSFNNKEESKYMPKAKPPCLPNASYWRKDGESYVSWLNRQP
jgi:hypothetical protein